MRCVFLRVMAFTAVGWRHGVKNWNCKEAKYLAIAARIPSESSE